MAMKFESYLHKLLSKADVIRSVGENLKYKSESFTFAPIRIDEVEACEVEI